jgi:hypothetical protein
MTSDLQIVRRVVAKWSSVAFESRYARLLLSMSRDQAKKILGFPPNYNPSEDEIKKNYKLKALENHPDRGGDLDKMVEVNVAKDILTGKAQEKWEPVRGPTPTPPARPRPEPPKRPEAEYTVKGETFGAAWSGAGIPSGTDWKFVSEKISLYSKGFPLQLGCVLYGQTNTLHVFCAFFKQKSTADVWPPTDEKGRVFEVEDGWRAQVVTLPITKDIAKIATKAIKQVVTDVPGPGSGSSGTPKKYILWPENGGNPTEAYLEKIPYRGRYSLKEVLVVAGLVKLDEGKALKTPAIVDFYGKVNKDKLRARPRGILGSSGDFYLIIDGKEVKLEDETCDNITKSFFLIAALKNFEYNKVYRLNRLKAGGFFKGGAGLAFKLLFDSMTTEPSWVKDALEKNMELFRDPEEKTASVLLDLCADMSLRQASVTTGVPMCDLMLMVYG